MAESRTARHIPVALSVSLRLALCGVFAYAGVLKLLQPEVFLTDVISYRLFPEGLARLIVYFVPALEIVCAIGLWLPRYRICATGILTLLLAAFTVLLAVSWGRGLDISCGCFGKSELKTPYPWLIIRDLALLALAVITLLVERHRKRQLLES